MMKNLLPILLFLPLSAFAVTEGYSERDLTNDEIRVIEENVKKESGYTNPVFKHNKLLIVLEDGNIYCGLISEKEENKFNAFTLILSNDNAKISTTEIVIDNGYLNRAKDVCNKLGYEFEGGRWDYRENKDEMRNYSKYYASLDSENRITTSFDNEEVSLYLRKRLKEEDVYFSISKGLFSCDPCKIAVKIDNNPIMYLNAERGESYSSLFLTNKKQRAEFVQKMKKGTKLIAELPIYERGKQQAKFTVKGLKWDHF